MLPGTGRGAFNRLVAARWITPLPLGSRSLYRTSDIKACIDRMEGGEEPRAVYVWKTSLGVDGANAVSHLVTGSRAACGLKREWMSANVGAKKCPHCMGHAKTYNVVEE